MISIVCPFYNEFENLKDLYERLHSVTGRLEEPFEIIFVDDGSKDEGPALLKSLAANDKSVRILTLERNSGLTTALYAGLEAAKGDKIATLDADLQNPPEEIPRLLTLLTENDMVTGYRKIRQDSWLKKISSKIANNIRRWVLKDTILDVGCSLRIFRKETLKAFYPYKGMHRFFPAIAEAQGFKILQVPVEHANRFGGKSKYGLHNRLLGPLWDLCSIKWLLSNKIHYKLRGEK